jgi:hypothetical protein
VPVPAVPPLRTPVTGSIVAVPVPGTKDQVPPEAEFVNVVVLPAHTLRLPPIAPGAALTVTASDDVQPVAGFVAITDPAPTVAPATNPGLRTVRTVIGVADQVIPPVLQV